MDLVTKEFRDEIEKLAKDGLTDVELVRAEEAARLGSRSAIKAIPPSRPRSAIDELVGLGYDNYQKRKERIEGVTLEEAKRVASKYFNVPGRVQVTVRPPEQTASNQAPVPQILKPWLKFNEWCSRAKWPSVSSSL